MKLTIDFLDGTDENVLQLLSVLQYGLTTAVEGELVTPDFETDLKAWMRVERSRLRPSYNKVPAKDTLRESRWFGFWSALEPEQEVRWTQTKSATYFVVTGELNTTNPDRQTYGQAGPWVQLRRHTGKTFWSHIAQVRPFGWVSDKAKGDGSEQ